MFGPENEFPYTGKEKEVKTTGYDEQNLPEIGREVLDPVFPRGKNIGQEPVEDRDDFVSKVGQGRQE